MDEDEQLLWFNGGLLKNKKVPEMAHEYMDPDDLKWADDGQWQKGADRHVGSCMYNTEIHALSGTEWMILKDSVTEAQKVDQALNI